VFTIRNLKATMQPWASAGCPKIKTDLSTVGVSTANDTFVDGHHNFDSLEKTEEYINTIEKSKQFETIKKIY
jgi:hypothetical protein